MIEIKIQTGSRQEMVDVTSRVRDALEATGGGDGLVHVFSVHTTAGMTVNEGADPDVAADLLTALSNIVPDSTPFRHAEGNSPAHVRTSLVGSSVTVPAVGGRLSLGTWQRIFFCEYDGPRSRKVWWKVLQG